jgi:methionine synthase II (cobalamin-independent)
MEHHAAMFATLLGSLPRPPLDDAAAPGELLAAVVRAQEAAGLEPLIDGGFGIGESLAERWRAMAALTDRLVKQAVLGPYSRARAPGANPGAVAEVTMAIVEPLRLELLDLVAAGCPMIEIHEPAATAIGADDVQRALFRDAHLRLLDGLSGAHLSLAITGGSAHESGVETLLAAPYASLAVDLIAGPDNWRLVGATPGERGIVCGALSAERDSDDRPEILLWAADYASSTGGRGPDRVGIASASSLEGLPWEVAIRKLTTLGAAARLAGLPADERRRLLDPRSVDSRSAALGRVQPRRPNGGRPRMP